jgi:hypothetical protein
MARWVALAITCLVAVACASVVPPTLRATPEATASRGPTNPPTLQPTLEADADDVLLRATEGGGLRYPGATVEEPPFFTLYGDGRVIYTTPSDDAPDDTYRLDLWQAQLNSEQMSALMSFALDEGGLASARERYEYDGIADAGTTWFDLRIDGVSKTVAVYALGYVDEDVPDLEMRARFDRLATELRQFANQVASGEAEDLGRYMPEAYLVTLDRPFGPMADKPRLPWPWDDVDPADFTIGEAGYRQAVITAEQAGELAAEINSLPDDLIVGNGERYLVRIRPLLPDQIP